MTRMGTRPHDYVLRHAGHAVEVTYKPIRSLRLRVVPPDGRLRASVPAQFDESVVRRFIDDNLAWIATAQQKVRMRAPLVEPLVDGGRAKLWGEWRELRVAEADRASARVQGGQIALSGPDDEGLRRALDNLYRRELHSVLPALRRIWEPRIGTSASSLKLRRMTSRWGTCNTRSGAITLNVALAEWPVESLEYVLVHELVHLWEASHGPRFTARMDEYLPGWRQRRAALKGR